jgi:hypothetical protein
MLSGFSPEDRAILYGVLGGLPGRFALLDPRLSARENILQKVAAPGSALYSETEYYLYDRMRETQLYYRLLYTIARGAVRMRDIVEYSGQPSATVNIYLNRLLAMHVITKSYPFLEGPGDSRHTHYSISDHLTAFYFYNFSAIKLGQPEAAVQALDAFMEPMFSQLCREYLKYKVGGEVGAWWCRNNALPITGCAGDGSRYAGLTRWCGKAGDADDVEFLRGTGRKMPEDNGLYYLFVKPGYTKECEAAVQAQQYPPFRLIDFETMMRELSLQAEPRISSPSEGKMTRHWKEK